MQNKEIVTQLPANPSEVVYAITMETILASIGTAWGRRRSVDAVANATGTDWWQDQMDKSQG